MTESDGAGTADGKASADASGLGCVDRYVILRDLGSGPTSRALAVRDAVQDSYLVLKLLPFMLAKQRRVMDRLRRHLAPAARFRDNAVNPLLHLTQLWEIDAAAEALGIVSGTPALVSGVVPGPTIEEWVTQRPGGTLDGESVGILLEPIADALDKAHGEGLIHGHVHPENIRVSEDTPMLIDLGIAREVREAFERAHLPLIQTHYAAWRAPEAVAEGAITGAADQYSLGLLCYRLLTGRLPAPAADEPDPVASLPARGSGALLQALNPRPDLRHDSCGELMRALSGRPRKIRMSPAPPPEPDPEESSVDAWLLTGTTPVPAGREPEPAAPAPAAVASSDVPAPQGAASPAADSPAAREPATGTAAAGGAGTRAAKRRAPSLVRTINVLIAVALVLLAILAGMATCSRLRPTAIVHDENLIWNLVDERRRPRLPASYVWTARMAAPILPGQEVRLRLLGQTRELSIEALPKVIRIRRRTAADQADVLGEVAYGLGTGDQLRVAKRPDAVVVFVNGMRVLAAPCPVERWEADLWETTGLDESPVQLKFQKTSPVVFTDDFMHGEGEFGAWRPLTGEWTVHALQNPVRSANPFSFFGKGNSALAVAGHWFQRNYRFAVSIHPLPGSSFGLDFSRVDKFNGYRLRWEAGGEETPRLRLLRVSSGAPQELAAVDAPFAPSFWTRIEVLMLDGWLDVRVDGQPLLRVCDPAPFLGGEVGLWTSGGEGTVFDDVEVMTTDRLALPLTADAMYSPSLLRPAAAGFDLGGILLENVHLETDVAGVGQGGAVEMLLRQKAGATLVGIIGSDRTARIVQRDHGADTELAREALPSVPSAGTLAFSAYRSEAWLSVDGQIVCLTSDAPAQGPGLCGVRTPGEDSTPVIKAVRARPRLPLPSIANRVETFTHEESMQNWNSAVLEWTPQYGGDWALYWHRSDFWQDVAARLDLRQAAASGRDTVWGLVLRNPTSDRTRETNRALLLYRPERRMLEFLVCGTEARTKELPVEAASLEIERRANRLLARANGATVWSLELPDALRGLCQVGRAGRGATEAWAEAVAIRAGGVRTYSFREAPDEWIPSSGTWQVTNRWQCDPRWSFYSGRQRPGVACNWNKLRHGPNVTIEFFAGPKMDQDRGRRYEYAADINAVICADGQSIASGYSFLFGGWNDRGSQIVRQTEILGENRSVAIPRSSSTHRRWFYVKIRKQGARLSFWVDGREVASVQDPQPLSGDRFGLWTWDNGIMVAQLRISSDTDLTASGLGQTSLEPPKTPYDAVP